MLAKTFETLGVKEKFKAVQFDAPHNYNQDSREAVYAWMVRWLQNGPDQPRIAEQPVTAVKREDLAIWTDDHKLPANAVNADSLKTLLRERVTAQLASLRPKDAASLKKYRDLMEPAWKVTMGVRSPQLRGNAPAAATIQFVVGAKPDEVNAMRDALNAQGKTALSAVLGPLEPEAAAGGDATQRKTYPTTFFRTILGRHVQAVLDAIGQTVGPSQSAPIQLIGLRDAGPGGRENGAGDRPETHKPGQPLEKGSPRGISTQPGIYLLGQAEIELASLPIPPIGHHTHPLFMGSSIIPGRRSPRPRPPPSS